MDKCKKSFVETIINIIYVQYYMKTFIFGAGASIPFFDPRGYGELLNQVVFYKNGYEAFLNEFGNVI